MGKPYNRCKVCHLPRDLGRSISKQGYCQACGKAREQENLDALRNKTGPAYQHYLSRWYDGTIAHELGGVIPERPNLHK